MAQQIVIEVPGTKISELEKASSISRNDVTPVVQDDETKQAEIGLIADLVKSELGSAALKNESDFATPSAVTEAEAASQARDDAQNERIDSVEHGLVSIGSGADASFSTYAEMIAYVPPKANVSVRNNDPDPALRGVYTWTGTQYVDGYDPLDASLDYINAISALTKNATVFYPFSTKKRNNISVSPVSAIHEQYLKSYILDIKVNGADPNKYYRIQQISTPTNASVPNRWVFEVLNKVNFDTAETRDKLITAVFPITKNTGIQTFDLIDGDTAISVTVDTNKLPASDFYSVSSADNSYTYIIDPSRYIASAFKKSDALAYVDSFSALTKNSTVLFPFSTIKRNKVNESTVGSHDNILRNYILNISVMNADMTKYYRLQQFFSPDQATTPNRWIFEVLNRANFDTSETRVKSITADLPVIKNVGIKTFYIVDSDLTIAVTVDTNKTPANSFYSYASTDNSYTYIIDPSLYFYSAVTRNDLNTIDERINKLTKPNQLVNLLNDLRNPIQTVNICFIGDSIDFGVGATGIGTGTHGTAIARCHVNLIRDYLGTAFCTSARFGDETIVNDGEAYYTSNGVSVLSSQLSYFTFKNSATGKVFSVNEMQALVGSNPSSPSGTFIDLKSPSISSAPTDMEFDFNGSAFTINYAKLGNGSESESMIDVFVNDELHSSFNVFSASPDFGFSTTISDLAEGKKKIRIANRLNNSSIYARLVSISATRKISVINEGVSGWSTNNWLANDYISSKITSKLNYVFTKLGTNDRHTTQKIGTFKNQYNQILDRIYAKNSNAQIIIVSPPPVTQDEDPVTSNYKFRIADVDYALAGIAKSRNISFISLFEELSKLKARGIVFLGDNIHPNDYGYGVIAEYIISLILSSLRGLES
ncbi:SGNH/GDSL hydrolase family protein [Acinetobacter baumannii]|nr:SGNH/GDSL hydrolase family protein [Acinetobacter baumannii]